MTLALRAAGFSAIGADLSRDAETSLGASFVPADLEAPLPWPDGYFDAVASIEGIEHLENASAFLRQCRRILAASGLLLLTTPNLVALRSRIRFLGSGFFHGNAVPLNEAGRDPLHHIGLLTYPGAPLPAPCLRLRGPGSRPHAREAGQPALRPPGAVDVGLHQARVPEGEGPNPAGQEPRDPPDALLPLAPVRRESGAGGAKDPGAELKPVGRSGQNRSQRSTSDSVRLSGLGLSAAKPIDTIDTRT